MNYGNTVRKYKIYVPNIYTTQNRNVPLVLGLHGFGDNIASFSQICMTGIADTANYIAVYPEALVDNGIPLISGTAWHSGASGNLPIVGQYEFSKNVNDVGFLNALLDTVIKNYRIDTTRIYCFGFSFGGFMTDRMAAEKPNRFAAVANVAGLRGNSVTAVPTVSMPYLHFHGTADETIEYTGTYTFTNGVPGLGMGTEKTVRFWVNVNHTDTIPVIDTMPDLANDGLRFIRYSYLNGNDNSSVVLYKVVNGTHDWYGTPTNDISYCQTIWKFFNQYKRTSTVTSIKDNYRENANIKIYPNPSNGIVTIDFSGVNDNYNSIRIYNLKGNLEYSKSLYNERQITLENKLATGMYIVELSDNKGNSIKQKLLINKH
jgi:polyhydroxybutyrate depolymerase